MCGAQGGHRKRQCITGTLSEEALQIYVCSIFCCFKYLQIERETEVSLVCLKRTGDSSFGYGFVIL